MIVDANGDIRSCTSSLQYSIQVFISSYIVQHYLLEAHFLRLPDSPLPSHSPRTVERQHCMHTNTCTNIQIRNIHM